jgi:hypothetical protein
MNRTAGIAVILLAVLGPVAPLQAQALVPVPLTPGGSVARMEPAPVEAPPPVAVLEQAVADDRERFWFYADYLLGFTSGERLLPLVTTSFPGTSLAGAGVLGPRTTVLFPSNGVNDRLRSGTRMGLGGWFDAPKTLGVDVGFLLMESQNTLFSSNSNENPILARPFINVFTGKQASQIVAFPGTASGSITASDRSDNLYGAHIDLQELFLVDRGYRLESLFGYRFLSINDRLAIDQNVKSLSGLTKGTEFVVNDSFGAQNQFHGVDLGVRGEFFGERWFVGLLGKIAVGDIHRVISIAGTTTITAPGSAPVTSPGGFLALSSNSGTFDRDQFTVVPELGAQFGWRITPQLRVNVGYSVLWLTDMARAGDQVNPFLNPNLFPPPRTPSGPALPFFQLVKSDMWLQTISLGMEFRY